VAGAILTRVKGEFSAAGVSGSIEPILAFAKAQAEVQISDTDPAKAEKVDRVVGRTYELFTDLLSASAMDQGFAFGHTVGTRYLTLTATPDGRPVTVTVNLPNLLRQAFEEGTRPPPDHSRE
jgi:hypothetical protein